MQGNGGPAGRGSGAARRTRSSLPSQRRDALELEYEGFDVAGLLQPVDRRDVRVIPVAAPVLQRQSPAACKSQKGCIETSVTGH